MISLGKKKPGGWGPPVNVNEIGKGQKPQKPPNEPGPPPRQPSSKDSHPKTQIQASPIGSPKSQRNSHKALNHGQISEGVCGDIYSDVYVVLV